MKPGPHVAAPEIKTHETALNPTTQTHLGANALKTQVTTQETEGKLDVLGTYEGSRSALWSLPEQFSPTFNVEDTVSAKNGARRRNIDVVDPSGEYSLNIHLGATRIDPETALTMPVTLVEVAKRSIFHSGTDPITTAEYVPSPNGTVTVMVENNTGTELNDADQALLSTLGIETSFDLTKRMQDDPQEPNHYTASAGEIASIGLLPERFAHYQATPQTS